MTRTLLAIALLFAADATARPGPIKPGQEWWIVGCSACTIQPKPLSAPTAVGPGVMRPPRGVAR